MLPDAISQFAIRETARQGKLIHPSSMSPAARDADMKDLRGRLVSRSDKWTADFHLRVSISGLYFPPQHVSVLKAIQSALDKALTSITHRWWTDRRARFPERMPLEEHEETLLRWMDTEGWPICGSLRGRKGCYRPDFLVEAVAGDDDGKVMENIRLCEINSRMPFNGYLVVPFWTDAVDHAEELGMAGVEPLGGTYGVAVAELLSLFDTSLPLHVLREDWRGLDIHFLIDQYERVTGQPARTIPPSHIRAVPDENSATGHTLYCLATPESKVTIVHGGERLEPVHQLSLELKQAEYAQLSAEALREIARHCVNDLRSVFLVNDERLLGILFDELEDLVVVQRVLTPDEAEVLRKGIAHSFLPSSETWGRVAKACAADPGEKDRWVLKAARDAYGNGHVFGTEVTADEWLASMERVAACNARPRDGGAAFVLQRRVAQVGYPIVRHGEHDAGTEEYYLVGSYSVLEGKFARMGPTRIGRRTHINLNDAAGGIVMGPYGNSQD